MLKLVSSTRVLRFLLSGASAAIVEYGAFLALHHEGVSLLVANSISFGCGLIVSFTLNRVWVFKSDGHRHKEFAVYLLLAIVNLVLSNMLVFIGVHALHIIVSLAKLIAMILIAGWNYYIFPKLVFRQAKD